MKYHEGFLVVWLAAACVCLGSPAVARTDYWQQAVRYEIHASLDTLKHNLTGSETVYYTNNSPDTLRQVWFHAYANAFRDDKSVFARETAREGNVRMRFLTESDRGYIEFQNVKFQTAAARWEYKPGDETEVRVDLPGAIPPGETVRFDVDFLVKIPAMIYRLGHQGTHYDISQWYPKMVVYDDRGWHPDGYHRVGEFYGDFGSFDVWLTVPREFIVAATGSLAEPKEEFAVLDSLAAMTERIASLAGAERAGARRTHEEWRAKTWKEVYPSETKTLHFRADNVHDFAWFANAGYLIRRARYHDTQINVYFFSRQEQPWLDMSGCVRDALSYYGEWYGEYPYAQMSVAEGGLGAGGGMEYPEITVISPSAISGVPGGSRSWVRVPETAVIHETGHQWFYGILGSNEMDEAWLDEGMTAFSENRYMEAKYDLKGNLTDWPKRLGWLPRVNDRDYMLMAYHVAVNAGADGNALKPSFEFPDEISYGAVTYMKGAWVMSTLREALGDSVFDDVMREYVAEWRFRHPHVQDFIEVAERVSGRDLRAFFHDYLETAKECDYAVGKVRTTETAAGKHVEVEIVNKGGITMPSVPVRLATQDGRIFDGRCESPGERGRLSFDTQASPTWVEIDPRHNMLEIDHWNDRRPEARRWSLFGLPPSFDAVDYSVLPYAWYEDEADHLRLGLKVRRGNFIAERPLVSATINYSTGSCRWGYDVTLRSRLGANRNRTVATIWGKDVEGYNQQRIGVSTRFGPMVSGPPSCDMSVEAFRNDVYDLKYYQPSDWKKGRTVGAQAVLKLETIGVHHHGTQSVRVRHALKTAGGQFDYTKVEGTFQLTWRWTRKFATRQRLYLGGIQGAPALQDRIYLAGGLDPDRRDWSVLDRRGTRLTPLERFMISDGPGLRGYSGIYAGGRHIAGHYGVGLRLEGDLYALPMSPVLFFDVGNVWPDLAAVTTKQLRADAGIRFAVGPLSLVFPVWLSDPPGGHKQFALRWLIGFGGVGNVIRIGG
jgi:hypothetical protein